VRPGGKGVSDHKLSFIQYVDKAGDLVYEQQEE
jgi:hypothetical protein